MPDTRLPKTIFYSQVSSGIRVCGRPVKRYKDSLKKRKAFIYAILIQQPEKQPPKIALCGDTPARWEYSVLNVNASLICSWREKEKKLASTSLHSPTTAPSADEDVLQIHMRTHKHWLLIRQLDGRFQHRVKQKQLSVHIIHSIGHPRH